MKHIVFLLSLSCLMYINCRWNLDLTDLFIYVWQQVEYWFE